MNDARRRLQRRVLCEFRFDQRFVAEQQEFGVGVSDQRNGSAGMTTDDADIAPMASSAIRTFAA